MAKTPKEPEKDNAPVVSSGDILPENQQPEQTAIPPFEPDTPPPEMSGEEAAVLDAEGMAATKLSTLMIIGVVIPFFIKENMQYVLSFPASFWMGKAILENITFYMFPGFVLSAIWI